ncbi:DUF2917 domain-containing protein [Acidovorax sp. Leaf78]|uniref:DUF2917 domain-containing protein n=1 Tax=unclassified Acidovorax TaxID=2684926 RepID=UPI0006FC34A2|nr:DUF2917 domain-containing protein [Acidovorax sp. Leaf78]KQO27172.1 hypothetical protein ASF16_19400 [Acidovorax sp. Leaf78]
MSARNVLESQQSAHAPSAGRPAAGCWKLNPGRALSLHPREHGVLAIAQGRAWVTLRGASLAGLPVDLPPDLPMCLADHVLQAGERLVVAPGQHVVMEAWSPAGTPPEAVAFEWAAQPVAQAQRLLRPGAEWECSVALPLRDLMQALGQGGRAVGQAGVQVLGAGSRLAVGIARFALFRIAAPRARTTA